MNPATPKTELPPSTHLRKAVFGGSRKKKEAKKKETMNMIGVLRCEENDL